MPGQDIPAGLFHVGDNGLNPCHRISLHTIPGRDDVILANRDAPLGIG